MNEAPKWTPADEAMRWLNEVELVQGGANGPTIKLRAAIIDAARAQGKALSALSAILADPTGCPYCDMGRLRKQEKPHDAKCGFALAAELMTPNVGDDRHPETTAKRPPDSGVRVDQQVSHHE